MSTRLARILAPDPPTNFEEAPTYSVSEAEALLRLLLTGLTGDTFYVTETDLAQTAITLFADYAERFPKLLTQAVLYAREQGYMRSAPITALVCLSAAKNPRAKYYFQRIAPRILLTPDDLQDFATLIRVGKLRGFGRGIRHAVSERLASMSEYHIIKYGAEARAMSLRDLYRLTHVKPSRYAVRAELQVAEKAGYLIKGELPSHLDQIRGYEQFKTCAALLRAGTGGITEADVLALLDEHRLPWEVATSQLPSNTALWTHLLYQMPIFALLRNLRNLYKYGVFNDASALEYATAVLTNPERIAASKLFPFRFYAAREVLSSMHASRELIMALDTALDLAYRNLPDLGNQVLIANDISGSMSAKASAKSDMTMADIAALAAAALYKHAPSGDIVSFDGSAHPRTLDRSQPTMALAKAIGGYGGGTALYAPIQWAFNQTERKYDTAIFFTDSESWVGELQGRSRYGHARTHSLALIRQYRAQVNPDLVCVFVQLAPYPHTPVPLNEPGCYFVSGWSDAVLRGIDLVRQSRLLDTVQAIQID